MLFIVSFIVVTTDLSYCLIQGLNISADCMVPTLLAFGVIAPIRQASFADDAESPKGVGVWGIVFMCTLPIMLVVTGLNIDNLSDSYYDYFDWTVGRVSEGFYTRLIALTFVPVMLALTFVMMFANFRDGYKANGIIAAVTGGLASTIALIGIGSDYFEEYGILATVIISVFGVIVSICSLISIMVNKDVAKGAMQKYIAFSSVSSILTVISCITYFNFMGSEFKYCWIIMLGLTMYVPTALKYISPKIKAPVIAVVFGLLLLADILLLAYNA